MQVGSSYYPELSGPSTWKADLATARSLGLTVFRCGEFAWSRLSPTENAWDCEWAVAFLDLAHEMGFKVVWCTPSATPPPYLFDRWPDLNAVTQENHVTPIGIRRNYCPSHAAYRQHCATTAGRLAKSLSSHPAIIGWQIDNEIAGDGFTCWCPHCQKTFQEWLEKRYGTLDHLNQSWQSGVWSKHYTAWNQIGIPQKLFAASHAPALKLAWRRFRSDNWLGFYQAQEQALRAAAVTQPITTNFFDLPWDIPFDHWAWRPHLDVMSLGLYVEDPITSQFEIALLRGLDEKRLWILEQKAGQQNAQNFYPESLDRIEKHLRICAEGGAEFATYWHLRQHQAGCEMEHGAVLRHDGKPTRVAAAVSHAIPIVDKLPALQLSNERALVFEFEQHWAQETRPQPGCKWDYREMIEKNWFHAAVALWGGIKIGNLEHSLQQATLVFAPHFQMAKPEHIAMILSFLERGGTFITTADFGRLDWENNVRPIAPLGGLASLAPIPGGEMLHLAPDFAVTTNSGQASLRGGAFWFVPDEKINSESSLLQHGAFSGKPFLECAVGSGRLYVFNTAFTSESLQLLLKRLIATTA